MLDDIIKLGINTNFLLLSKVERGAIRGVALLSLTFFVVSHMRYRHILIVVF